VGTAPWPSEHAWVGRAGASGVDPVHRAHRNCATASGGTPPSLRSRTAAAYSPRHHHGRCNALHHLATGAETFGAAIFIRRSPGRRASRWPRSIPRRNARYRRRSGCLLALRTSPSIRGGQVKAGSSLSASAVERPLSLRICPWIHGWRYEAACCPLPVIAWQTDWRCGKSVAITSGNARKSKWSLNCDQCVVGQTHNI
jgi:hypothetical protein